MTDIPEKLKQLGDAIEDFWTTRDKKSLDKAQDIQSSIIFFLSGVEALNRLSIVTSLSNSSDLTTVVLGLVHWQKLKTMSPPRVKLSKVTTEADKAVYAQLCQQLSETLTDSYYTHLSETIKQDNVDVWNGVAQLAE